MVVADDYWARAIYAKRLWYSTFEDVLIQNGVLNTHQRGYGFYVDYSVNNSINNSNLLALDYCVYFSTATHPVDLYVNEGWTVSDSILIASNYGVHALAGTFFDVHDCVIDIIYKQPIYMGVGGTGAITNNWIAVVDNLGAISGVYIEFGDRFTIMGNIVSVSPTLTAIEVDSNYCSVISNTINNADIGILVVGNYCAITGNSCSTSTTYAIRVIGTYGQIHNNIYDSATISITQATSKSQNDKIALSTIVSLTGGISQNINIPITSGLFDTKPLVGIIQVTGDSNIIGSYLVDDAGTTTTNAKFVVRRSDGTTLPSGSVRFSVFIARFDQY